MSKELPYFRFYPQEYQNGDISLEDYELQGLFVSICCYYWVKDCSITKAMLNKRYKNEARIKELFDLNILKVGDNGFIAINFLNEQFDILSTKRQRRQEAGRLGGLKKGSNAKAMLKQKKSYKDKDKDNYKDKDKYTVKKYLPEAINIIERTLHLFDEQIIKGLTKTQREFWITTIERLHEIDGYSWEDIEKTIIWAKQDNFWNSNVVTIPPLRKKRDGASKFYKIRKSMSYEGEKRGITKEKARNIAEITAENIRKYNPRR